MRHGKLPVFVRQPWRTRIVLPAYVENSFRAVCCWQLFLRNFQV
jgi:hypothetical protein